MPVSPQLYFNDARDIESRAARHKSRCDASLMALGIATLKHRYPHSAHIDLSPEDVASMSDSLTLDKHTFGGSTNATSLLTFDVDELVNARSKWRSTSPGKFELNQAFLFKVLLSVDSDHWEFLWLSSVYKVHTIVSDSELNYYYILQVAPKGLLLLEMVEESEGILRFGFGPERVKSQREQQAISAVKALIEKRCQRRAEKLRQPDDGDARDQDDVDSDASDPGLHDGVVTEQLRAEARPELVALASKEVDYLLGACPAGQALGEEEDDHGVEQLKLRADAKVHAIVSDSELNYYYILQVAPKGLLLLEMAEESEGILSKEVDYLLGACPAGQALGEEEDDRGVEQLKLHADAKVLDPGIGHCVALWAERCKEELEREQAELAVMKAVAGSVFSLRKPRDVVAGTSSGLKTVARGVGLGLASLVAQPYLGAKHGGAKGFVKGVGAGVTTCVGSTVAGAVVGTTQIVRGAVNTPGAIMQKARGQVWNSEARAWEVDWYSLPEEVLEVFGENGIDAAGGGAAQGGGGSSSSGNAAPSRPRRKVVDTALYDLLEVAPEATEGEIRKAFYKKSLALHPDKNRDNPEATQQFQAVSDAYRVLGDEDRRKEYDERGKDSASEGMPKIEPAVFFAALFGSHHFEPWVGRLKLAQDVDGDLQSLFRDAVAGGEDDAVNVDVLKAHRAHQRMKALERQRQVRCAVLLERRLRPVVEASEADRRAAYAEWEAEQARQVEALTKAPCGVEMLSVIGWVYANRSRQFFAGSVIHRAVAQAEGKLHMAQSKVKLAGSLGRTAVTVNGVMKKAEKKAKQLEAEKTGAAEKPEAERAGAEAAAGGSPEPKAESTGSQRTGGDAPDAAAERHATSGPDHRAERRPSGGAASPAPAFDPHPRAAAAEAAPPPEQPGPQAQLLQPGTLVMLRGLRAAELNNEVGMVVGFDDESQRYMVQMIPDGGLKKLREENLMPLEVPGADGSGFGGAASSGAPAGEGGAGGEGGQWAPGGAEAEMQESFKDCMPLFHDAFWSVTALDIEFTLSKVIQRLLRDMSVDKGTRRARAEALLKLGSILQAPLKELRARKRARGGSPGSPGSQAGDQARRRAEAQSTPREVRARWSRHPLSSRTASPPHPCVWHHLTSMPISPSLCLASSRPDADLKGYRSF
ncbi:unnamed protein product [Prorocentrum cordatum]|uniref:J domain-containing protein n=1 Tax=Prorocentrum cordatum TaxID=2364126 RepID=A0ABN9SGW4_9DINO|nr:unnamed protein product [Polarella glacialis]